MASTPNDEIFSQASQTKPMTEIVDARNGTYKCLETSRGASPPPATPTPFKTQGA